MTERTKRTYAVHIASSTAEDDLEVFLTKVVYTLSFRRSDQQTPTSLRLSVNADFHQDFKMQICEQAPAETVRFEVTEFTPSVFCEAVESRLAKLSAVLQASCVSSNLSTSKNAQQSTFRMLLSTAELHDIVDSFRESLKAAQVAAEVIKKADDTQTYPDQEELEASILSALEKTTDDVTTTLATLSPSTDRQIEDFAEHIKTRLKKSKVLRAMLDSGLPTSECDIALYLGQKPTSKARQNKL